MSDAIILAIVLAAIAAVVIEVAKRPFRAAWAWARRWALLIRDMPRLKGAVDNELPRLQTAVENDLPRLDLAVETIAWRIAREEADYGGTEEEHEQAISDLRDYLTGRRDAEGLRLKPRSPFG